MHYYRLLGVSPRDNENKLSLREINEVGDEAIYNNANRK